MDGVGLPLLLRVLTVCAVSAWSGNLFSDKLARLFGFAAVAGWPASGVCSATRVGVGGGVAV